MSWSIDVVGSKTNVLACVNAPQSQLPDCLKQVVKAFLMPGTSQHPNAPQAVRIKTSGHYDSVTGWNNIYEFSINPVTLAPDPELTQAGLPSVEVPGVCGTQRDGGTQLGSGASSEPESPKAA